MIITLNLPYPRYVIAEARGAKNFLILITEALADTDRLEAVKTEIQQKRGTNKDQQTFTIDEVAEFLKQAVQMY